MNVKVFLKNENIRVLGSNISIDKKLESLD